MTRPICPHCKQPLEYDYSDDTYYDTDKNGNDQYFVVWYGYCEPCNRDFQWREKFILTEIEGLKEVGE